MKLGCTPFVRQKAKTLLGPAERVVAFDWTVVDNQPGWRSGGELCWRATRQGITNRKLIKTMSEGAAAGLRPPPFALIGLIDFPHASKTPMVLPRAQPQKLIVGQMCAQFLGALAQKSIFLRPGPPPALPAAAVAGARTRPVTNIPRRSAIVSRYRHSR